MTERNSGTELEKTLKRIDEESPLIGVVRQMNLGNWEQVIYDYYLRILKGANTENGYKRLQKGPNSGHGDQAEAGFELFMLADLFNAKLIEANERTLSLTTTQYAKQLLDDHTKTKSGGTSK